jgi:2'-5' RNA ligase
MQHPFINDETKATPAYQAMNMSANEYLLIIQPSTDVSEKIMQQKKLFAEKYDCPSALYSKPHITLINFLQWPINERNIIHRLTTIIETIKPFMVSLKNFGSFPSHTIYANVETKNAIVDTVKSLRPIQSFLKLDNDNKPHYIVEPHVTIARKLQPWQYEQGWLEYSNSSFSAQFMVHQIVLLKKNIHAKKYQAAANFSLLNKPSSKAHQANLFT